VDDVGRALNPMICTGKPMAAFAQGRRGHFDAGNAEGGAAHSTDRVIVTPKAGSVPPSLPGRKPSG